MTHTPAPPAAGEFLPYYGTYISLVPEGDVIELMSRQVAELGSLVAPLSDDAARFRYAPDKWSIKEVLGHLGDTERIFGYRMLRVCRGDETPLAGFDEKAYAQAGSFDHHSVGQLMDNVRAVRASTLSLARGIGNEEWMHNGVANGSPVSARALIFIIAGHTIHHTRLLRERYNVGAT